MCPVVLVQVCAGVVAVVGAGQDGGSASPFHPIVGLAMQLCIDFSW